MNCDKFIKEINTYLDGELGEDETIMFKEHIKSCQACRKELRSFEKCIELMQKFMHEVKPPEIIKKTVFEKVCPEDMINMCCGPKVKNKT